MPTQQPAASQLPSITRPRLLGSLLVATALLAACASPAPKAPDFYSFDQPAPGKAGMLLRSQPLPAELGLSAAGRQMRILYTSTDGLTGQGQRVTSGAVFYPAGNPPEGGWPIIAWAHGTTGVGDACAPSRNARSKRDADYLNAWLKQGFVVVATDYQGLGTEGPHLYLNAKGQAYAMLDAVRAVLGRLGDVSNRVILLGQSQGGGAVIATAGYAPEYAPDLKVLGTVATGAPNMARSNPSPFKPDEVNPTLAYLMYVAQTVRAMDPTFEPQELFSARALPVYAQSDSLCIGPMEKAVVDAGLTNANTLIPSGLPKAMKILGKSLQYPTLTLSQPLFMGTGGVDKDVSTEQQLALGRDACKAGARLEQHVYPGLDHSGTVNASLADSVPFVRKLLAGEAVGNTCDSGPIEKPAQP